MIFKELDHSLRSNTLDHLGVDTGVPGFRISVYLLTCVLLVHNRDLKLMRNPDCGERYTSELLMNDLQDLGVLVDQGFDEIIFQAMGSGFIHVDENDYYYCKKMAQILVKIFAAVYPTMKGLELVAYMLAAAEEVKADQLTIKGALDRVNHELKTKGVSLDFSKTAKGLHLVVAKLADTPPAKATSSSGQRDIFKSLYDARLRKKEKTVRILEQGMGKKPWLPILCRNHKAIKSSITQDFSATSDFTDIILSDAALTLNVLKAVNKNKSGALVGTVSHAVMLLGRESLKKIVLEFEAIDSINDGAQKREMEHSFIAAHMSYAITRRFAIKQGVRDTEELCIAAMLHNLGQMLVLVYYPEAYFKIKDITRKINNKRKAARQVLGTTYDTLGIVFARRWHLPYPFIESLRVCYFNRVGRSLTNMMVNFPFCSTELCAYAGGGLDDFQKLRTRNLINSLNLFSREINLFMQQAWEDVKVFSHTQELTIQRRALSEIAITS